MHEHVHVFSMHACLDIINEEKRDGGNQTTCTNYL